ncbi:glucokinase [Asticcacaulis sp. AC402]|uniref:glucokinase n=1 Tax=Asticcacaulis sp. AC402 TaxID=1282361 RepID=UPI0003C3E495|nr:glucokinase [Asticcacaulis sp. AC402]ESQ73790.1 hypothetical protein ABAC402_17240 [Asticcacaulis sp. AC402]
MLSSSPRRLTGLVGDIGGTNARFAIATRTGHDVELDHYLTIECSGVKDFHDAVDAYGRHVGGLPKLDFAVVAVAGPVKDGAIKFTNLDWLITERDLADVTRAPKVRLINDYAALAYCLPYLTDEHTRAIGPVTRGFGEAWSVFGPGTGFGASVLVGGPAGPYCLSTETGHISFAPVNDFEAEIRGFLQRKLGRATLEMILSGQGIVNLYRAICAIHGETAADLTPAQITQLDSRGGPQCRATVETFLDILASTCGEIALAHGATSGVYIAGGIAPRLMHLIDAERFRARMEAKAPMAHIVAAIPSRIIIHPYPALLGAAEALTEQAILA